MKTYSFLRETAPVIMKNAPKEGIVLKSSAIITHSDTPGNKGEKWLKQNSAGYLCNNFKTNNESAARDALVQVC